MNSAALLIELQLEELPPKSLKKLSEAFAALIVGSLQAQGLLGERSVSCVFATPRRLAVHVTEVHAQAGSRTVAHKLMPISVGLNEIGLATPALLKKLTALGLDAAVLPALEQRLDGKSMTLFVSSTQKGVMLTQGVQLALHAAVAQLPVAKLMQYQLQDGWTSVQFVRPAHGLIVLHGTQVLPCSVLGLTAGRHTLGHRFEALARPIVIEHADRYEQQLRDEGAVMASFEQRRLEIVRQMQAIAQPLKRCPIDDAALLDEVTALVEHPHVLLCQFDPEFLAVPAECLILTMKANQKYFPLLDEAGQLTHQFLVISNIRPADASQVVRGNERVVRPRLADAKFFFDQDRKKTLASRVAGLDQVMYHGKLGTQGQRMVRVRALAQRIAHALGGDDLATLAAQAAELAKTDLLTDMVGEFPELQGTMGRYYALHDGLPGEVALAIEDHYKPRFAQDELPRNGVGVALALADKLESLVGLFGLGLVPTGDKDPFALRRQAFGVIRLLMGAAPSLRIGALLAWAWEASAELPLSPDTMERVRAFIHERLAGMLREQGASAQEVDAVLSLQPEQFSDIVNRLAAVRAFAALPQAQSLAAANKRVTNILKKNPAPVLAQVDTTRLIEPAEQALYAALGPVAAQANAAFEQGQYTPSLQALAQLKDPVDAFFASVMVNAQEPDLRANRLGLLATLHGLMNRVADLSKLALST